MFDLFFILRGPYLSIAFSEQLRVFFLKINFLSFLPLPMVVNYMTGSSLIMQPVASFLDDLDTYVTS